MEDTKQPPAFNEAVKSTLTECLDVTSERGAQYRDTWALPNQISTMLDAAFQLFTLPPLNREQKRIIQAAVLADIKDSRMIGAYKRDSVIDGINYRAVLAEFIGAWLHKDTQAQAEKARSVQ